MQVPPKCSSQDIVDLATNRRQNNGDSLHADSCARQLKQHTHMRVARCAHALVQLLGGIAHQHQAIKWPFRSSPTITLSPSNVALNF